jgi:hypothetical protein
MRFSVELYNMLPESPIWVMNGDYVIAGCRKQQGSAAEVHYRKCDDNSGSAAAPQLSSAKHSVPLLVCVWIWIRGIQYTELPLESKAARL